MLSSAQQVCSHSPLCQIRLYAVTRISGWTLRTEQYSQRLGGRWQAPTPDLRRQPHTTVAAAKATTAAGPASAKDAVDKGLQAFNERRDAAAALSLFEKALELSPTEEEARAAVYNSACAHAKLKQWKQAADAAVQAINKYGEPLSTAIKDPDLERLRERREWMDALDRIKGAPSAEALSKLQSEARAPFRFTRLLLLGGFNAGAVLGLLIIISRLLAALKGGEGAPDLTDTLKNLAINGVAIVALSLLLARDLQSTNKDNRMLEREESLSRLQINLGGDRVLPLAYLRGRVRPVIVAGTSSFVSKAVADAEPHKRALRERGMSIIPVRLKAADPSSYLAALKAEFKDAKGFGEAKPSRPTPAPAAAEALSVEADKQWKLEAAVPEEWEAWLAEQKKEAKVTSGNLYLQVQLNGKVRASAEGRPPWEKLAEELPPLDDLRTKISDGLGRR